MSLVLQIILLLALVTVVSKGAGTLSNRCGQPAVFGEVLAGLLLGPSLLNVLRWSVFAPRAGDVPGLGGVVLPLVGGAAAAHLFGYGWGEGFFMGAVLTATSVSISAQTLMELKSLRSREGSTILGAAVIDDVMGIIVLSLVVAFVGGRYTTSVAAPAALAPASGQGGTAAGSPAAVVWVCARMTLFFVLSWLL